MRLSTLFLIAPATVAVVILLYTWDRWDPSPAPTAITAPAPPAPTAITAPAPPADIFKREPRNEAFAARMERLLRWRSIARLGARFDEIPRITATCHTSSCEIVMGDLPQNSDSNAFLQALDLSTVADTIQIAETPGQISLVLLFSNAQRDADVFAADMKDHAAGGLPAKE